MATFREPQTIHIPSAAVERASTFADAVTATVNYRDSNQTELHKTQRRSAAKRYGLSWTFQDSPERRDPILDMPDAWVCLVVYEDLKDGFECLVYPLRKIKQLIFEAPRLSRLVGKKQAVYLETLQQHKVFK